MSGEPGGAAEIDRLIHEPARLAIVAILAAVDSADFLFLLHQTRLTRGNLSAQLSRLEAAGYICIEKGFRGKIPQTLCRITPQGKEAFAAYRKQMRSILK